MCASTVIKNSLPSSLIAFVSVVSVPIVSADSSGVALSYEADGACYCTNAVSSSSVAEHILPTPIGGQTIAQICSRIGNGPGLQIDNGKYSHAAYSDTQCGHGLSTTNDGSGTGNNCLGLSASGESVCGRAGPKWDLAQVFSGQPSENTTATQQEYVASTTADTSETAIPTAIEPATTIIQTYPVDSASEEAVKPTANVAAIAQQLRAFNHSIDTPSSNIGAQSSAYSHTSIEPQAPAAAHGGAAQTTAQPGVSAESYTLDTTQYQQLHQESIKASEPAPLAPTPEYLTQEEISVLPEAATEPVPNLITHHSSEIIVTAEEALPGTTTVIVIEPESTPRQMTQAEIMQLPLLTTDEQLVADTPATPEETEEPTVAAAITPPTPTVPNEPTSPFKRSRLDYSFVSIAPTGFDFGGTGAELDASVSRNNGVALIGNAGIAEEYAEASAGLGFYLAPFPHRHTDVVLAVGAEYGTFDLGITDLDDVGGFIDGYIRTRPLSRFELTGGVRYSSFFDGDTILVGSGLFSFTPELNIFGKFELGDNDQFSLGFRYFY